MKEILAISLWAALFTGPLTEPGQVFGWAKAWVYRSVKSEAMYNVLVGCAKCHAGQVALWYQLIKNGIKPDIAFIVFCISGAMLADFIFNKIK